MYEHELLPINHNLHLLLGAATGAYVTANHGSVWASDMLGVSARGGKHSVFDAWNYAGTMSQTFPQSKHTNDGPVVFRVAGWPGCFADNLSNTNSTPGDGDPGDIYWIDTQVAPPPQ